MRAVDEAFERLFADGTIPGMAYGVVIAGDLVHARGLGTLHQGEDRVPDADSVFRIASMTKSFTASAVLLLRDEGALLLDEPVGTYVPELAGFRGATADSPLITVRHLLTMSSGLPTDDPWGDRLQGLPLDAFAELLGGGFTFAWPPGTAFEYSNLGYGILGRVLTNVSGQEYRDLIRDRLLTPLGMDATVYEADQVPDARLARGHVHRDGAFVDEPFDPYGALASMGGVFSSVRDLTTWVHGFAEAFPARDDPEGTHPLSRASRREMQQVQRAFDPELGWTSAGAAPSLLAGGYGFGLFVSQDLTLGHVVDHSGGYPGFGSHMRWHPASGVGVIALGNRTYAPMSRPATEALKALVAAEVAAVGTVVGWDATEAARADVERLLAGWDGDLAARLLRVQRRPRRAARSPKDLVRGDPGAPRSTHSRSRRVGDEGLPGARCLVAHGRTRRAGSGGDPHDRGAGASCPIDGCPFGRRTLRGVADPRRTRGRGAEPSAPRAVVAARAGAGRSDRRRPRSR